MVASTTCTRGFPSLFSRLSTRQSVLSGISTSNGSSNGSSTSLSSGLFASRRSINHTQIRTQLTARRTTKRLRQTPVPSAPKPHASATSHTAPLGSSPTPAAATSITFDPPSSAPSPFHTPAIFLPESDPRRKLLLSTTGAAASSTSSTTTDRTLSALRARYNPYAADPARPLPPSERRMGEKRYHLTEADVREMRALRGQDPAYWTRSRLAEKFGCSEIFVAIGAPANAERRRGHWAAEAAQKAVMNKKRRGVKADRAKRRELWFKDA